MPVYRDGTGRLSDLHAVGNVLRTACSKRGRDVRDMIPLVEFVFYYKSKSEFRLYRGSGHCNVRA